MNFYASRGFLDAAAAVYFKGRETAIADVRIGDDVLRLLVVDGKKIVTRLLFLDFHQPLAESEIDGPVRPGRYAQWVSRGVIEAGAWNSERYRNMDLAPFIDWTRFACFEDYREQLLTRHRGLVRDRERRGRALASQHGKLTFTMDDQREDVLALARAWKGQQLNGIGFPDFFDDPQTMEFFACLRERGLLVCSSLRAGGRLVSTWIGFVHQGAWSGWIFTYDPVFKKYSAGHQLLIRMIEESYRLGHHEFDFSIGAPDYKMFYATHGRLLGSIGTPSPKRAMELYTRKLLRQHSPGLFAAALRAKWILGSAFRRTSVAPATAAEREL
jgi:hypothetical protein